MATGLPQLKGRYGTAFDDEDLYDRRDRTARRWIQIYASLITAFEFELPEGAFGLPDRRAIEQELARLRARLAHWRAAAAPASQAQVDAARV